MYRNREPRRFGVQEEGIRVRREQSTASKCVSQPALIACERQLNQVRRLMIEVREAMEHNFYIAQTGPIEPTRLFLSPGRGSGRRQSD